jgi:hypothetical protein
VADEPETTEPDAPEPDGQPTVASLDARLDRIEQAIREFFAQPGQAEELAAAPDIKAEVRAAVAEVQAADKADQEQAAAELSLKEQIGQLRAQVEKPPQEYKRATERMGWAKP